MQALASLFFGDPCALCMAIMGAEVRYWAGTLSWACWQEECASVPGRTHPTLSPLLMWAKVAIQPGAGRSGPTGRALARGTTRPVSAHLAAGNQSPRGTPAAQNDTQMADGTSEEVERFSKFLSAAQSGDSDLFWAAALQLGDDAHEIKEVRPLPLLLACPILLRLGLLRPSHDYVSAVRSGSSKRGRTWQRQRLLQQGPHAAGLPTKQCAPRDRTRGRFTPARQQQAC